MAECLFRHNGYGDDGDANVALVNEKESCHPEMHVTNNITGQGDIVKEATDAVFRTLDWVEERIGVPFGIPRGDSGKLSGAGNRKDDNGDQDKADADLWSGWETAKAAKVLKADFAADKGMSENELQNALDRHRKRLGR